MAKQRDPIYGQIMVTHNPENDQIQKKKMSLITEPSKMLGIRSMLNGLS